MTRLGSTVLTSYYLWLMEPLNKKRYNIVVEDSRGNVVGFCFGGRFHYAIRGFIRRNFLRLCIAFLTHPSLLLQGNIMFRLALIPASLFGGRQNRVAIPVPEDEDYFGILSIATHPDVQGQGYGRQLMAACRKEAQRRNIRWMILSVRSENIQAITFYEKDGWKRFGDKDDWQGVMFKEIS